MPSHFDEKSGVVRCQTPWGAWYQTVEEVVIELEDQSPLTKRDIMVKAKPNHLTVTVRGQEVIKGKLNGIVVEDETIWTIEDQRFVRIALSKADVGTKDSCWEGLLQSEFLADPLTFHEMRKKLDLERFQIENPGFDFSSAKLDKRYEDAFARKTGN